MGAGSSGRVGPRWVRVAQVCVLIAAIWGLLGNPPSTANTNPDPGAPAASPAPGVASGSGLPLPAQSALVPLDVAGPPVATGSTLTSHLLPAATSLLDRDVPTTATATPASPPLAPNSATGYGAALTLGAGTTSSAVPAGTVVGIAATASGNGYWLASSDGSVLAFGDAPSLGSVTGTTLRHPVVGIAATPHGAGYWLVTSNGAVFPFGDAGFFGSDQAKKLDQPIVGMAPTADGRGYWLAAADGGIFSFGDAAFLGSPAKDHLSPIVGIASHIDHQSSPVPAPAPPPSPAAGKVTHTTTPAGATRSASGLAAAVTSTAQGYWLVSSDGNVLNFGDAGQYGSVSALKVTTTVAALAETPDGQGYWELGTDGGVFNFGDAKLYGSAAGSAGAAVVAMAGRAGGYWIATGQGTPAQGSSPLVQEIQAYAQKRSGNITAAVFNANTGETYAYRPGVVETTASMVKVDILATLLSHAQAAGRALNGNEKRLATAMIEHSDNTAASALYNADGRAPKVAAFNSGVPMASTVPSVDWGLTRTTALDQVTLMRHVAFPNSLLSDTSRAYELDLMEHVESGQAWGVSGGVPSGVTVALKNGWRPTGPGAWQVDSVGYISGQGRNYVIAVLTGGDPGQGYGIQTIQQISAIVWKDLG